jgi:hypothetical protein
LLRHRSKWRVLSPENFCYVSGVELKRMKPKLPNQPAEGRPLELEEVRLISDLRVMHAKVEDLYRLVENLKRRHDKDDIYRYADREILGEGIDRVDSIYMWFLSLKEKARNR